MTRTIIVGLISDPRSLPRPEAPDALAGRDLIAHAGDVGDPAILTELRRLAPVHAIRDNIDRGTWPHSLPGTDVIEVGGSTPFTILLIFAPSAFIRCTSVSAPASPVRPAARIPLAGRNSVHQPRQRRSPPVLTADLGRPCNSD